MVRFALQIALLTLMHCSLLSAEPKRNLLIFGGNGMLGSETVYQLLEQPIKYDITIVSRGGHYWDFQDRIKPHVYAKKCNRHSFESDCEEIINDGLTYEAIIDFSCYYPRHAKSVLEKMHGRFKKYIYISSDSVYEVSIPSGHRGFSREEDAIRPESIEERKQLEQKDSYGHRKLAIEELLEKKSQESGFKYVSLRLPDMMGPRDNTYRWWKYHMWTKLNQVLQPVDIPVHLQGKPLSFVFTPDVARMIVQLIPITDDNLLNQAYNLAFDEAPTLKDVVLHMGKFFGYDDIDFDETEEADILFGLPSVTRGPIDTSKAKRLLNWQPTDLQIALRKTCRFYEQAEYNKKFRQILDLVLDNLGVRGQYYRQFLEIHQQRATRKIDEL